MPGEQTDRANKERMGVKEFFLVLKGAFREFGEDKAPRLGAALAYYTVFSLAPTLIIVIAVAGLVLDPGEAETAVLTQMRGLMGEEGAAFIETTLAGARAEPAAGVIATIIGIVTLLFGAIGAFGQLQDALNTIWEVKPKPGLGLIRMLRVRLLSLSMVLVIAFFLMVSLALSAGLALLGTVVGGLLPVPEIVMQAVNFVVSFAVITLLFGLMFKFVPDAEIAWRDVWVGAALTALLFTLGKILIGLYLGNAAVMSTYGAAGSLVVLLLWVYFSAQILFFGAEFTQVYANRFGSRVAPAEHAVAVTVGERANQGLEPKGKTAAGESAAGVGVAAADAPLVPAQETVLDAPAGPALTGREALLGLLTFAAGLGAGALVAAQSMRDSARKATTRRRQRIATTPEPPRPDALTEHEL